MIYIPLVAAGALVGKPYDYRVNVFIAHASGDGAHQILGIVLAGACFPGFQLGFDITGMLAGNAREYITGTEVARAMAAFAGNNVLGPVAALGRLLSTLQRSEERRVGKECRSRWSTYH